MAKLQKLLSIRTRIIGDFEHHLKEIEKFGEDHNTTAITFRSLAFEKTFREYTDLLEELEKCQAYHEIENITDLINVNRAIQDKYLAAKIHIAELLPEHEITLNDTFNPNTHRDFREANEGQNTTKYGFGYPTSKYSNDTL